MTPADNMTTVPDQVLSTCDNARCPEFGFASVYTRLSHSTARTTEAWNSEVAVLFAARTTWSKEKLQG